MAKLVQDYHIPIGKTDYISIQHIERYYFACSQICPGQRVLDVAAGLGYGTIMMQERGCQVFGADFDHQLLSRGSTTWESFNFAAADALHLPMKNDTFDVIVSFETIEHVYDGCQFLDETYRVLKPGGTLICSTPNICYTSHPSFHLREYEPEEFYDLIRQKFGNVKKFGQYYKPTDRAYDLYKWYIRDPYRAILKKTKLINMFSSVTNQKKRTDSNSYAMSHAKNSMINELHNPNRNPHYQVTPLQELNWLRIMAAVAKKEQ